MLWKYILGSESISEIAIWKNAKNCTLWFNIVFLFVLIKVFGVFALKYRWILSPAQTL